MWAVRSGARRGAYTGVMGLHKLTAGDGYTYLTRQVAVQDATERGHSSLGDYYAERGKSPGRWWGSGLAASASRPVRPSPRSRCGTCSGRGGTRTPSGWCRTPRPPARPATWRRGRAGWVGRSRCSRARGIRCRRRWPAALVEYNCRHGRPGDASVPTGVRARIRTSVADELFPAEPTPTGSSPPAHDRRPRARGWCPSTTTRDHQTPPEQAHHRPLAPQRLDGGLTDTAPAPVAVARSARGNVGWCLVPLGAAALASPMSRGVITFRDGRPVLVSDDNAHDLHLDHDPMTAHAAPSRAPDVA